MTATDPLTATVRITAPPEAVFPYFTDPTLMVQWIGNWAELHPEPGGSFALDIQRTPVRGTYTEVDPPRRVVFTWGVPGRELLPPGSSTVEVLLTADGPDTIVTLLHHGLPPQESGSHLDGWTTMLDRLASTAAERMNPPHSP